MAKIEMDISEYKEMEKNAALLEDALKREKKHQEKYDALKDEQVQILKDNSKIVTIINRTEKTEHLIKRRDPHEVLQNLQKGDRNNHNPRMIGMDSDYMGIRSMHGYRDGIYYELDHISRCFFDTHISMSTPEETVTTQGLDEYLVELEKKIKGDIDSSITEKLYRLDDLETSSLKDKQEIATLKLELKKSEADLAQTSDENVRLEELIEANDLQHEIDIENFKAIKEELNKSWSIMSASKKLNKIKTLI